MLKGQFSFVPLKSRWFLTFAETLSPSWSAAIRGVCHFCSKSFFTLLHSKLFMWLWAFLITIVRATID